MERVLIGVSEHSSLVPCFYFPFSLAFFSLSCNYLGAFLGRRKNKKGKQSTTGPRAGSVLEGFSTTIQKETYHYHLLHNARRVARVFAGLDLRLKQRMDMFYRSTLFATQKLSCVSFFEDEFVLMLELSGLFPLGRNSSSSISSCCCALWWPFLGYSF